MKIRFTTIFFALFAGIFTACSESHSESPAEEIFSSSTESYDGMILVEGSQDTVFLGTNKKNAKGSESPEMKTLLNYDFFLDIHETTCEEFKSLMDKKKIHPSPTCESDKHPVSDITFFDAVLFANEKSKAAGMDTAYEYTSAVYDEAGRCTQLFEFSFHADRKSFRLPTEAEWLKAAGKNFEISKSFNNSNSDYKAHTVCANQKDSLTFCDFSGNVMEWTTDYMGIFKDTVIVNYAGAPAANDLDERIVKGGSFLLDPKSIHLYSRGDVYTVTSASHAEYVGFRLALGAIPDAVYLNDRGVATLFPISILANQSDIWTYTKTSAVKLAFRNDVSGNLAYIDYESAASVTEIVDTLAVYHPDISPDGRRVAFCTGIEGVSRKSTVYVRNLDSSGSELVKLDVESAAIPRWSVLESGDTVITYVTNAGDNTGLSEFKSQSTWQVPFANGKFGSPRKLFDGAYHGGVSEDGSLAIGSSKLLRANIHGKDTVWFGDEQACNASLSKDGQKNTAFLDFGSKTGKAFVGKSYSAHEYILIADSTGKLKTAIAAPDNYTFDHTEWALGKVNENIVASLTNADGAHSKIALVHLADSSVKGLVESSELWHPSLWIQGNAKKPVSSSSNMGTSSSSANGSAEESSSSTVVDPDSAGQSSSSEFILDPDSAGLYYNNSGTSTNAIMFRYKMELLWKFKDSANVAILGSSRLYNGIIPLNFNSKIFAVNLAIPSTTIAGNSTFFYRYIKPHFKHLKLIIISIDLDRGHVPGTTSANMFHTSYKSYPGYVYDQNHNYWVDNYPEALYEATYNSPGTVRMANALRPTRGHKQEPSNGWGNPVVDEDSNWVNWADPSTKLEQKFTSFEEFLRVCHESNIIVIGVITPQNPAYKETGALGRHGMLRSSVPANMQRLEAFKQTYPNFIIMDENKMGDHDYTDEMAMDTDHLSTLGAQQLTSRIDSLIQTLPIDWDETK